MVHIPNVHHTLLTNPRTSTLERDGPAPNGADGAWEIVRSFFPVIYRILNMPGGIDR